MLVTGNTNPTEPIVVCQKVIGHVIRQNVTQQLRVVMSQFSHVLQLFLCLQFP
jgi:hypothetical protein